MLLINITDPVGSTVELSRAVTEQGISNVLSGLMILTFIVMGGYLMKTVNNTIHKISDSIDKLNEVCMRITDQNTDILNSVSTILNKDKDEALTEQTKWNAERLFKVSFDKSLVELMGGIIEILTQNHIQDEEFTDNRVRSLVNTVHFDRVRWLNSFRYKTQRLGEITDNKEWVNKKISIIKKFIYSDDKNKDALFRELKLNDRDFIHELKIND